MPKSVQMNLCKFMERQPFIWSFNMRGLSICPACQSSCLLFLTTSYMEKINKTAQVLLALRGHLVELFVPNSPPLCLSLSLSDCFGYSPIVFPCCWGTRTSYSRLCTLSVCRFPPLCRQLEGPVMSGSFHDVKGWL